MLCLFQPLGEWIGLDNTMHQPKLIIQGGVVANPKTRGRSFEYNVGLRAGSVILEENKSKNGFFKILRIWTCSLLDQKELKLINMLNLKLFAQL